MEFFDILLNKGVSPLNRETNKKCLDLFRSAARKKVLGGDRIEVYNGSGFETEKIDRYCDGTLEEDKKNAVLSNLLGYEFAVYLVETLQSFGVRDDDIKSEVPASGYKVDMVASFNGSEKFKKVLPSGKEKVIHMPKGIHTFEVKATNELKSGKVVEQVSKAKKKYKDNPEYVKSHVLILKDTKIYENIVKKINDLDCDVLKADITKKQLMDRLNKLFKNLDLAEQRITYNGQK